MKQFGIFAGIAASSIWGGMYVVSKVVLDIIPPFTLLTIRLILGSLTLGMMARVALGHTGRMLEPARSVGVAFALVVLAGALRVLPPLFARYRTDPRLLAIVRPGRGPLLRP